MVHDLHLVVNRQAAGSADQAPEQVSLQLSILANLNALSQARMSSTLVDKTC